jgi:DNA-binding MarR family transcriptional regulator
MGGLLVTSILSGNLISRLGRYRVFPIVGTALMAVGLFLLGHLTVSTSTVTASLFMLVMGLGLGMVMQVLVLAVQNSVDYKYLGVATSGSTLFRQIGGSIGVSAFGAIFSRDLATELAKRIPPGVHLPAQANPAAVKQLPPAVHTPYIDAFAAALHPVFLAAAGIAVVGFGLTWLLREVPLRQTARAEGVGESFASPRHDSSEREIERILSSLMQREERERVYERLIDRSGVEITPPEGWLLRRIAERPGTTEPELSDQLHVSPEKLRDPLLSLTQRSYISMDSDQHIELTSTGQMASDQLIAAGREQLCRLLDGWEPEHDEDLQPVLRRLAGALVVEMPGR